MQIYLARDNQQAGPYTLDELNQMLSQQQVLLTDLMWHKGMSEWKPVAELTHGQYVYTPTSMPATTPLKPADTPSSTVDLSKSNAYPNAYPHSQLKSQSNSHLELASLPARAAAKLIDFALWIPMLLMPAALMSSSQRNRMMDLQQQLLEAIRSDHIEQAQALNTALFHTIPTFVWLSMCIYFVLMLLGQGYLFHKTAQTIGKKVMNLQIVDTATQQPVGLARGFVLRSGLFIALNFMTNFLISLLDYGFAVGQKRQTLHDKIARTQVVVTDKKN